MATWRQLKRSIAKAKGTFDYKKRYLARHNLNQGLRRSDSVDESFNKKKYPITKN